MAIFSFNVGPSLSLPDATADDDDDDVDANSTITITLLAVGVKNTMSNTRYKPPAIVSGAVYTYVATTYVEMKPIIGIIIILPTTINIFTFFEKNPSSSFLSSSLPSSSLSSR